MVEICGRETFAAAPSSAWVIPRERLAVRIARPSLPHEDIPVIALSSDCMTRSRVADSRHLLCTAHCIPSSTGPFEVVGHPLGGPLPLGGRHRFRGPAPSAAHNQDVLQKISHANKHIANLVHVSSVGAGLALGCPQRADGCEENAVSCWQAVLPGVQQNADAEEAGSDGVDAVSHPAQRLEMVLGGVASGFCCASDFARQVLSFFKQHRAGLAVLGQEAAAYEFRA